MFKTFKLMLLLTIFINAQANLFSDLWKKASPPNHTSLVERAMHFVNNHKVGTIVAFAAICSVTAIAYNWLNQNSIPTANCQLMVSTPIIIDANVTINACNQNIFEIYTNQIFKAKIQLIQTPDEKNPDVTTTYLRILSKGQRISDGKNQIWQISDPVIIRNFALNLTDIKKIDIKDNALLIELNTQKFRYRKWILDNNQ